MRTPCTDKMGGAHASEVTWSGILAPMVTAPVQVRAVSDCRTITDTLLFYTERAYRLTKRAFWVPLIALPLMCVIDTLTGLLLSVMHQWPGVKALIHRGTSLAGSFGLKIVTVGVQDLLDVPVSP